jgi:hypothetical protein
MTEAVFDARFYVSFGWDGQRKCWVVQARDQRSRKLVLKRDVRTSTAMSTLDVKHIVAAIATEMESWLPW